MLPALCLTLALAAGAPDAGPGEAAPAGGLQALFPLYGGHRWADLAREARAGLAVKAHPGMAWFLAVAEAQQGHREAALEALEQAVAAGLGSPGELWSEDLASLRGEPRFKRLHGTLVAAVQKHDAAAGVGAGLTRVTPRQAGVDPAALEALVEAARKARSSALVVLRDGKLVGEWQFAGASEATETMSATKAVTALAVGVLLQDGKVASLDAPLTTWFPEWKDGVHDAITLRHVLTHTSGLDAPRRADALYQAPDTLAYVLGLPLASPPGERFFYNNAATTLVSGVVLRATGRPPAEYLKERLFAPLGITDYEWQADARGLPLGFAGLQLHAVDLARLGQLVLQRGKWNGKQLLPEAFVAQLAAPSARTPTLSLLWWLGYPRSGFLLDAPFFARLAAAGADPSFVTRLEPLRGQRLDRAELGKRVEALLGPGGMEQFGKETWGRGLEPPRYLEGGVDELSARGSFDQLLAVFPSRRLVVVRLTQEFNDADPEASSFPGFDGLARRLVP